MSRVRLLISAITMLRLLLTVVLPSLGLALVRTSTCGRVPFCSANRMEVAVVRKDSARSEVLSLQETISSASSDSSAVSTVAPFV